MSTRDILVRTSVLLLTITSAIGALPSTWHATYAPTNTDLTGVTYGNDIFVAVGHRATRLVSHTGRTWNVVPNNFFDDANLFSVAYGNGRFIAVGESNVLMLVSTDGTHWERRMAVGGEAGVEKFFGITFGHIPFETGRFVAVGTRFIITGTDDTSWTNFPLPNGQTLRAVTSHNGLFVAVGDAGTIVTSQGGYHWSLRNSGTLRNLRAVTFSRGRFIAAGDAGTILSSADGYSWSAVAPASFDVKGLASDFGTLVAVGNWQSEGRLHASADAMTWSGDARSTPQALNAIAYLAGRYVAVGNNGLIFQSNPHIPGLINRWTRTTSGNWEELAWSRGELPSADHQEIHINNPGWKAVAIGTNTTANHPSSLRLKTLLIDAPVDSRSLLLLNWAGLSVPLEFSNDLFIGQRGSLLSHYSAIRGGSMYVGGSAVFNDYGEAQFNLVYVGADSPGHLVLSNDVFSANLLLLGTFGPGVVDQAWGSNHFGGLHIGDDSVYNVKNGTLHTTPGWSTTLQPRRAGGWAELRVSGGAASIGDVTLGNLPQDFQNSQGSVVLTGGELHCSTLRSFSGRVNQSGGAHLVDTMYFPAQTGFAFYDLTGGTLHSGAAEIGTKENICVGQFRQFGGSHSNLQWLHLNGSVIDGRVHRNGTYEFRGGYLNSPGLVVDSGWFKHWGGTSRVDSLTLTGAGSYSLLSGKLFTMNTTVRSGGSPPLRPEFGQNSGEHHVSSQLRIEGRGIYHLNSYATLNAPTITLEEGELRAAGGVVSNQFFYMRGGATLFLINGYHQFGRLRIAGSNNIIDFALGPGSSTVRFLNAGYPPPYIDGFLSIKNRGFHDQLFIGAITENQLRKIAFINPDGFSPGNYPARQTATGEIVPADSSLTYQRNRNNTLTLTWPDGYRLYSSTNVNGPFNPWPGNATSPFTVLPTDPRRFFIIRPQ